MLNTTEVGVKGVLVLVPTTTPHVDLTTWGAMFGPTTDQLALHTSRASPESAMLEPLSYRAESTEIGHGQEDGIAHIATMHVGECMHPDI